MRERAIAAALLLLASVALLRPSVADSAARRVGRLRGRVGSAADRGPGRSADFWRSRAAAGACALVALAAALLLPVPFGFAAAPVIFAVSQRLLRLLPDGSQRPPPAYLLAAGADLLAACLEAGALPAAALSVTGASLPDPLGAQLAAAGKALADGAPMEQALPESGALAALAAVFRRSSLTGSAMTDQLLAVAEQVRADDHFDRLERARRVAVLSALPLGVCMLPAFLLLSVVPAVTGLGVGVLR